MEPMANIANREGTKIAKVHPYTIIYQSINLIKMAKVVRILIQIINTRKAQINLATALQMWGEVQIC